MISVFRVQTTGNYISNLTGKSEFFFRAGVAGMKSHKCGYPGVGQITPALPTAAPGGCSPALPGVLSRVRV